LTISKNTNLKAGNLALTSIPACRKTLRAEKNDRYFDLKNLKICAHLNISYNLYKLCSVATPGHPEPLPLENYVCIVALMPDLQRVSFYSVTEFLYHSSTTELILSLILIKGSYLSSKALLICRKSSLALVAAVACKFW
jgi:hypothetical protein